MKKKYQLTEDMAQDGKYRITKNVYTRVMAFLTITKMVKKGELGEKVGPMLS